LLLVGCVLVAAAARTPRRSSRTAPIDDLGFVDRVAASSDAVRQGAEPDGAVDVGDRTARPADDVVVVVPDRAS
jgi:hypothetical protein